MYIDIARLYINSHHFSQSYCFLLLPICALLKTIIFTEPLRVLTEPTIQTADVGKSAIFTCIVTGYPVRQIIWYKDGELLKQSPRVIIESDRVVKIPSISREDKGMYQCIASNDDDIVEASSELRLGGMCDIPRSWMQQDMLSPFRFINVSGD